MSGFRLIPLLLLPTAAVAAACAVPQSASAPPPATAEGFRSGDCNLVSDADVNTAAGAGKFDKVVVGDAGCFWQEKSMIGSFGAGMGISTWWYRGSDLDAERTLERKAGRKITELSIDGNTGFRGLRRERLQHLRRQGRRRHHVVDPDHEPGARCRRCARSSATWRSCRRTASTDRWL